MPSTRTGFACALVCAVAGIASAQPAAAEDAVRYTWADVAKWPDFGAGSWAAPFMGLPPPSRAGGGAALPPGIDLSVIGRINESDPIMKAPLRPDMAKRVKDAAALTGFGGSGAATCEPLGIVNYSGSKFYFNPEVILLTGTEASNETFVLRRIYLNRTTHPDVDPSYYGDSIGHWEGDTLVVDTTAIRAEAQLIAGAPLKSFATHIVERFRLTGPDTLQLTKTIENPEIFTQPWTVTQTLRRTRGKEPLESYCWHDRESESATRAPNLTPER